MNPQCYGQDAQAGATGVGGDIEAWLDPHEDRLREECGVFGIAHNAGFYHAVQSSALLQIERIKAMTFANSPAHQLAIKYRIRRALDEK